jgi:hypothetical protein
VLFRSLVQLTAKIEGLTNEKPTNVTDTSIQFTSITPDFEYDLTVFNVKPIDLKIPKLTLNHIVFPNTQTVNFHWKEEKDGYPISFSVVNTNQYFKVNDIQSYAIPSLKKEELEPNFWNRIKKFSKTTTGKVLVFGAGLFTGVIISQ